MAKTDLVPIKVILNRRASGGADWPDFNQIDASIRNNQPWSHFIDNQGISWHYDKVSNLGTGAANGTAMSMVPADFANAAVILFPSVVSIIDEATFETFYEDRVSINAPIEHLDTEVLQGIAARVALEDAGTAPVPSAEIIAARTKCLDPSEQNYRGIRKNMKKVWEDTKGELNITVHPNQAKS